LTGIAPAAFRSTLRFCARWAGIHPVWSHWRWAQAAEGAGFLSENYLLNQPQLLLYFAPDI
jgi:hypothetical protein